jgi:hypothetical protein
MDIDGDHETRAEELFRTVDAMLERSHRQMARSIERLRRCAESASRQAEADNRMISEMAEWRLRSKP